MIEPEPVWLAKLWAHSQPWLMLHHLAAALPMQTINLRWGINGWKNPQVVQFKRCPQLPDRVAVASAAAKVGVKRVGEWAQDTRVVATCQTGSQAGGGTGSWAHLCMSDMSSLCLVV
jgi:hypothetical protein